MPKELNPLLHSQLRLGVMSILKAWRDVYPDGERGS